MGVRGNRKRLERIQLEVRDTGFRLIKNVGKSVEFLGVNIAIVFASAEKFKLQSIHFDARNTTNTCIILIVKIDIITILGGKEDT